MTASLHIMPNIAHPDDLYQRLIEMHDGLDDRTSSVVNAKLILLLANHIGDETVIRDAIGFACQGARASGSSIPEAARGS